MVPDLGLGRETGRTSRNEVILLPAGGMEVRMRDCDSVHVQGNQKK
jgi:hypothetical protein